MKKLYLLLPLVLLLSACEINVGFLDESHEPGLDHSVSSQEGGAKSYSYINNTSLDNSGLSEATLTFSGMTSSTSNIKDFALISSYVSIDQEIFTGVSSANYFNTKEGIAFLGADSSYVDGQLTLNFNVNIKNIAIKARPYSYIVTPFNEEQLMIDHEVAICVNSKGYIKLDETETEDKQQAVSTTCSFALGEGSNSINIEVGKRRAIIEEIKLFY